MATKNIEQNAVLRIGQLYAVALHVNRDTFWPIVNIEGRDGLAR